MRPRAMRTITFDYQVKRAAQTNVLVVINTNVDARCTAALIVMHPPTS